MGNTPDWISPMLATLTERRFSDSQWIYEPKLDGVRVLVFCKNGEIRLMSRNKNNMNNMYPEIVEALKRLKKVRSVDYIADGEIVTYADEAEGKKNMITSFGRLQARFGLKDPEVARATAVPVYLYLFDLPFFDGQDLRDLPLLERKKRLKQNFSFNDQVIYTQHVKKEGEKYFEEACRKKWEGVIAKEASSIYESRRSPYWLKFKCVNRQELVIAGYTKPRGSRPGFGAMLVGYYDKNGDLKYAGKVGTGFDTQMLKTLAKHFKSIEQKSSPFADRIAEPDAHWIIPHLVGEFGFSEWTSDGRLRHPRFLGIRPDKDASEVRKEIS